MKVDYKLVQKRRDDIMILIQKLGKISSSVLAKEFNVSEITIRRDLQYWEDKGAILRYHGGAKIVEKRVETDEKLNNERYKRAIAKYAAQLVNDGDTIFINSSSTALLVIEYLVHKRVNVITNNARAIHIKHDPLVTINLTGGELRYPKEVMVGEIALQTLSKIIADKCFLGCSGIDTENGMTTAILSEVPINEKFVNKCKGEVFVLCDYTKINQKYSFISAPLEDISYLITDINAPKIELEEFNDKKVKTVTLEPLPYNFK